MARRGCRRGGRRRRAGRERRPRGRRRPGRAPPYASRFLERDVVADVVGLELGDVGLAVAVARGGEELDAAGGDAVLAALLAVLLPGLVLDAAGDGDEPALADRLRGLLGHGVGHDVDVRSEEHTSELQSRQYL